MNEKLKEVWDKLHSMYCELDYSLDWMVRGREPHMPKQFLQMILKYQIRTLKDCKDMLAKYSVQEE